MMIRRSVRRFVARRLAYAIPVLFVLCWLPVEVSAQPAHPVHRYMVAEHAAFENVAAALTGAFKPLYIRSAEIPDTLQVGEEGTFSIVPNVETATLPFTVRWDFGDGEKATGMHVRHTFSDPGSFDVTVTASNSRSEVDRTYQVVVERADR